MLDQHELDVLLDETALEEYRLDTVFMHRAHEGLLDSFYQGFEVPDYKVVFAQTPYAALAALSPWFFELNRERHFWTTLRVTRASWGFLLVGEAEFEQGLGHWRSLLNVLLPDDSITHFRFYSPNVLFHIANTCKEHELTWLVGPYAFIILPIPANRETPWALISNPRLSQTSALKIAFEYKVREKVWWHVTEEQLAPFKDKLDKIFADNLVVWLWQNHADAARYVHAQGNDLRNFVGDILLQTGYWGIISSEQKQRCVVALLHSVVAGKPVEAGKIILANTKGDPERALRDLEKFAGIE